jgi:molybdenum cofactor guanylyltransferase
VNRGARPSSADTAGFVLAGGESSRMGADKALTPLCGKRLIVHTLEIIREAGLPVAIAGARSRLETSVPVVEDRGGGPLSGIVNALRSTPAGRAVFLAVDMPLVPSSLITFLIEQARLAEAAVVHASVSGFVQTFPLVVDRALLPALEAERGAGSNGCFSTLRAAAGRLGWRSVVLPVELLAQSGHLEHPLGLPPAFWFLNVNTRRDLECAERILAPHRVS